MRVTVCELPHRTDALAGAWAALCRHTVANGSQLVLLPELAMVEPVWESAQFDAARWVVGETVSDLGLRRLHELQVDFVVNDSPTNIGKVLAGDYQWSSWGFPAVDPPGRGLRARTTGWRSSRLPRCGCPACAQP